MALKVLQARRIVAMDEQEVFEIIAKDPSAWDHVAEYFGVFVHEGPYGRHPCIVLEVLGITIRELVRDNSKGALSTEQVKRVAKHLLLALECCHRQGIIYTGMDVESVSPPSSTDQGILDIKHSNLMAVVSNMEPFLDPMEVEGVAIANTLNPVKRYYPLVSQPIKAPIPGGFVIKLVDFGSGEAQNPQQL